MTHQPRNQNLASELSVEGTVAKTLQKLKLRGHFFRFFACFLSVCLFGSVSRAQSVSIPMSIEWPKLAKTKDSFQLEIADEPTFSKPLLQKSVTQKQTKFSWKAPKEGIYHWRLIPRSRVDKVRGPNDAVSTFVSGSSALIGAASKEAADPELSWEVQKGADSYRVIILGVKTKKVQFHTTVTPEFKYVRLKEPAQLTIVAYTGTQRTMVSQQYLPSLQFKKAEAAPAVAVVPTPSPSISPEPSPTPSESPAPSATPAPTAAPTASPTPEPAQEAATRGSPKVSWLEVFGFFAEEKIAADKTSVTIRSLKNTWGFGYNLLTSPVLGFVFSSGADAFRHSAAVDKELVNKGVQFPLNEPRTFMDFGLGYDVMDFFKTDKHKFILNGKIATTITPMLPVGYDPSTGVATDLQSLKYQLAGGGFQYIYHVYDWWFHTTHDWYRMINAHDNLQEGRTYSARIGAGYNFGKIGLASAGAVLRESSLEICNPVAVECQKDGRSITKTHLQYGYIGAGLLLK